MEESIGEVEVSEGQRMQMQEWEGKSSQTGAGRKDKDVGMYAMCGGKLAYTTVLLTLVSLSMCLER